MSKVLHSSSGPPPAGEEDDNASLKKLQSRRECFVLKKLSRQKNLRRSRSSNVLEVSVSSPKRELRMIGCGVACGTHLKRATEGGGKYQPMEDVWPRRQKVEKKSSTGRRCRRCCQSRRGTPQCRTRRSLACPGEESGRRKTPQEGGSLKAQPGQEERKS